MEEKKYPKFEEDQSAGMCNEPAVNLAYNEVEEQTLPVLGPATWEEAISDLEESEREVEAGECIPWDEVMSEIKERYKDYAY